MTYPRQQRSSYFLYSLPHSIHWKQWCGSFYSIDTVCLGPGCLRVLFWAFLRLWGAFGHHKFLSYQVKETWDAKQDWCCQYTTKHRVLVTGFMNVWKDSVVIVEKKKTEEKKKEKKYVTLWWGKVTFFFRRLSEN